MKTLLFALIALVPFSLADADEAKELRLLSYNIHAGVGGDGEFDLERIAKVIKSARPHVVALQEVDKETTRSKGIDIAKRLAELTGMKHLFGASIEFGGGYYGNAILTNLPIETTETVLLPEKIAVEKRSVLVADLNLDGETIRILVTHFCHREEANRVAAVEAIAAKLVPADMTSFVMGDLNATPDSKPLKVLAKAGWRNPSKKPTPTFPAADPTRQIDFVLHRTAGTRKDITVKHVRVLEEEVASDHRPLLVVFER
ncbi:MAG: endonuclease/exonuclease/phosphatase family metal-dependent hydrolase [Verrucomicrobiales bacterium]|jgi:endonuclease/exonuclease/phosphatase family metal-dependent hydrolase